MRLLTGSRAIKITNNMGHSSLISHNSGEVDGFLGVVTGEGFHFSAVSSRTLARKETQRAVARSFVLTVTINKLRILSDLL